MSTRSATIIKSKDWQGNEVEVARFYRHCDGYPEGHGADLALAIEHADIEGGYGCQNILANLLNMNCRIEFEKVGTEHGDIEFLYIVHADSGIIDLYESDFDCDYKETLAKEPLFTGSAAEYLKRFPCCYTQAHIKEHTTYHVAFNGGDDREHFSDLAKARQFRDEAPDAEQYICWDTVRSYVTFGGTYV